MILGMGDLGSVTQAATNPTKPPSRVVTPFLIYYGWVPSAVPAFDHFVSQLTGYPIIVLGSGDEWASSGDQAPVTHLIRALPRVSFYGYVNLGMNHGQPDHPFPRIEAELKAWRAMGVRGVLLDCAGPDYGVTSSRLRSSVAVAHREGLRVLVNAFEPRAVLLTGLKHGDAWLAENWVVADGQPDATTQGFDWAGLAVLKKRHIGIWMTATDATPPTAAWVQTWVARTEARVGGSATVVAGPNYSSQSNAIVPAQRVVPPA